VGTIEQGVKQAVENCLRVKTDENAVIITDSQTIEIGSALKTAIEEIAGETRIFVMSVSMRPREPRENSKPSECRCSRQ
jgi:hypothetical protein